MTEPGRKRNGGLRDESGRKLPSVEASGGTVLSRDGVGTLLDLSARGPGGASGARSRGEPERAVALLPAPRHHTEKGALHASEQSRPDVMEAREAWFEGQLDLDPERVVFIDETAAATNMERRYGRAPRGERCRIAVPHGHYKTTTVTAALRASGPFAIASWTAPQRAHAFRAYVTDTLVPALTPGDTVVHGQPRRHKVAGVRKSIEAAGAHLLYLPGLQSRLQPDRDGVRQDSRRSCARQRPAPSRIYGRPSGTPSPASRPAECRNYLAAAGYDAYDPA